MLSLYEAPYYRHGCNHVFLLLLSSIRKNSCISLRGLGAEYWHPTERQQRDLLAPDSGVDGGCFATPHQLQSLGAGLSHPQVRSTVSITTLVRHCSGEEKRAAGGGQLAVLAPWQLGSPSLKENPQLIFPAYFLDLLCWSHKAQREYSRAGNMCEKISPPAF